MLAASSNPEGQGMIIAQFPGRTKKSRCSLKQQQRLHLISHSVFHSSLIPRLLACGKEQRAIHSQPLQRRGKKSLAVLR